MASLNSTFGETTILSVYDRESSNKQFSSPRNSSTRDGHVYFWRTVQVNCELSSVDFFALSQFQNHKKKQPVIYETKRTHHRRICHNAFPRNDLYKLYRGCQIEFDLK